MVLLKLQIVLVAIHFNLSTAESGILQNNAKSSFLEFLFSSCKCKCGLPNRQARPSAGEYLKNYEFPWLAVLQIKEKDPGFGALINNKYVITTASLLMGLTPFDVKVTLGQNDRCHPDISSLNISVERLILHKGFNPVDKVHDIALLKLSSPVIFEKRVSPICLSTPHSLYTGQVATFVGWSEVLKDKQSLPSCHTRKVGLPVLDIADCQTSAIDPRLLTWDKRCAGIIGTKNTICKWDQGGPVMYRSYGGVYELIGIVSETNDCSENPGMAMYVTINDHLQWIVDNTKDACYCLKTR